MPVPEKPALEGLEAKWAAQWEASGTYRFDRTRSRDEVYSIDTPPPTVSGSLHVGHAARVSPSAAARSRVSGRSADAVGCRFQDGGRAGRARRSRDAERLPSHRVREA